MCEPEKNEQPESELAKLIRCRRSIRKYKPDMPSEKDMLEMIRCAAAAPSPSNSRPVRFFRVQSGSVRKKLQDDLEAGRQRLLRAAGLGDSHARLKKLLDFYHRYSVFMFDAPVLLAVATLSEFKGLAKGIFDAGLAENLERMHWDLALTAGLAIETLLLKAVEAGLGACILTAPLTFLSEPEKILKIDDLRILAFVTVGYPDEQPEPRTRDDVSKYYAEL